MILSRLQDNRTAQEYTLSGLNLGTVRLRLLAQAVEKNSTLLGLHLCRKQITDTDMEIIVNMLAANTKLQKLELEGNSLGPAGARTLAKALENNSVLRYLDLESNPLTGMTRLDLLSPNPEYSRQDRTGIEAIAEMLRKNRKLLVLNLGNTGISDNVADVLVSTMKVNTTLISLEMQDNGLSVKQTREIEKYLMRNKKAYDEERLREFKERKLMHEEDTGTKNLVDIEEKKKEELEIQKKNKEERQAEREKKYAEMVLPPDRNPE